MRNRTVFSYAVLAGVVAVALTPSASRAASVVAQAAPASNVQPASSMTLDVKPVVGSESIAISGTSAAGRPILVALYATYSRDLPNVLLSRRTIVADDRGSYRATVPIAPGFFRGAIITVVTTALPSGASASAQYTVGAPNITVPPDNLPHNVQ